ncbi:MAG: hypothetical protein GJU72_04590 [Acidithiobacillus ferriphilus]|uniref:hypothetical protein n=1 Tax=Acidithiobacillus ferriphilus TaxID=1689834 RepID=UPI00242B6FAD|nr:hypothetical protein [Acidithiobacillus ferriphilus]MBW9248354.1 hypothetical protein [Acidithiobacillus ferriphilus]MBW9253713.1 hypothetical protein [Acidithiobacillus ferriphilus]
MRVKRISLDTNILRKNGMPAKDAAQQVHDWMVLFPTVTASPAALSTAMSLVIEHSFSFWNALLIAMVMELKDLCQAPARSILSTRFAFAFIFFRLCSLQVHSCQQEACS